MPAVLVTGPPGSGKTTLVLETLRWLQVPAGGFYTQEMRQGGRRVGFRLVTLDGREAVLASVNSDKRLRVSRYGIELSALDDLGVPAILEAVRRGWLVVVDEIGKMELLSERFRAAVLDALDSGRAVFGTIMLARHPFADAVKARDDVEIVMLTPGSRAAVEADIRARLRSLVGG